MKSSERNQARSIEQGFGIPELDAADRQLGALARELNRAIADGRHEQEIQRLMDWILRDAIDHFEHEERVMLEISYPLPKGHAALHRQIRAELEHATQALRDTRTRVMWPEYGLLVAQLFFEHMRQEAARYRAFLHSGSNTSRP